jgi:hypothetical protein
MNDKKPAGKKLKLSPIGGASKPLSLHPVNFEDVVSALLKTPPSPVKPEK